MITVEKLRALNPCEKWTTERLKALLNGQESMTLKDFLDVEADPAEILWAVLRSEFINDDILRSLAFAFYDRFVIIIARMDSCSVQHKSRNGRALSCARSHLNDDDAESAARYNCFFAASYDITEHAWQLAAVKSMIEGVGL